MRRLISIALFVVATSVACAAHAEVILDLDAYGTLSVIPTASETYGGTSAITGTWGDDQSQGYAGQQMYNQSNNGGESVTWTLTGLTAGDAVKVYVSWDTTAGDNRVNDVTYTVSGILGGNQAFGGGGSGLFNQDNQPADDFSHGGRTFQLVGTSFTAAGSDVALTLTDIGADAGQYYLADAAAFGVTPIPEPSALILLGCGLLSLLCYAWKRRK